MDVELNTLGLSVEGLPFGPIVTAAGSARPFKATFSLQPGESLIVVGSVGTGKSDAAVRLAGLDDSQDSATTVRIGQAYLSTTCPLDTASRVALIPSNPALLFSSISTSLRRELEFSYEFIGRSSNTEDINLLLQQLELDSLAHRDPLTLSGGERIRAAIAIGLAKSPQVVIVDQVFEELDAVSERVIRDVLAQRRIEQGIILVEFHSRAPTVVTNHDQQWLFITPTGLIHGTFDRCWEGVGESVPELLPRITGIAVRLQKKYEARYTLPPTSPLLVAQPFVMNRCIQDSTDTTDRLHRSSPSQPPQPPITIRDLEFEYKNPHGFRLGPISHAFPRGRATALIGRNGAGKTTLLRTVGNLNQGWSGEVRLNGDGPAKTDPLHVWARYFLYCFQNPDDQMFFTSVYNEIVETARRIRDQDFDVDTELRRVTSALGLDGLLKSSPFDLPRPYRRLVSLAGAFVASPPVLLMDEPTGGLDGELTKRLIDVLRDFLGAGGTAVIVSHDFDFIAEVADNVILLEAGKIRAHGSRESGFDGWVGNRIPAVISVARELEMPTSVWREKNLLESLRPRN